METSNKLIICGVVVTVGLALGARCWSSPEHISLFYSLAGTSTDIGLSLSSAIQQPTIQMAHTGPIIPITGVESFNQQVIARSMRQPIVLSIAATLVQKDQTEQLQPNPMQLQMKKVIEQAATEFAGQVGFAYLDISEQGQAGQENRQIVEYLIQKYIVTQTCRDKLTKTGETLQLEMPIFLLFKHGELYRPLEQPASIFHGKLSLENIVNIVQAKFSIQQSPHSLRKPGLVQAAQKPVTKATAVLTDLTITTSPRR